MDKCDKCRIDIKLANAGILLHVDRLTGEDKVISQKWCLSCVHNWSASILKE